jgi:hypothetical protein
MGRRHSTGRKIDRIIFATPVYQKVYPGNRSIMLPAKLVGKFLCKIVS